MKRKENVVIAVILLVMILAIVGVSYAAFSFSKTGSKVNSITTGSITMTYTEDTNGLSLNNALPTTDKTGMVRLNPGEYFDFTVSSEITGDVNINYEISAKKEDGNTIDGKYIKLYLTKINDDSKEEGVMAPSTYNEETSSNEYTGRPSNEMSLYTSSMNSSETNKYRLRMYVDESYNPQGDGGGLTFSVRINVYGKAGDKYVPETTEKILADNELQVEKEKMFNYASNGGYFDTSSESQLTNPEYVTNGLYSMEDEDGISYYYRGAVDNNNVQFGKYEEDYYVYKGNTENYYQSKSSCEEDSNNCTQVKLASAGDKMYWKIIRVNGDGSLRLIYNGTSTTPSNSDLANSDAVGIAPYNLESNDPKYAGYTYDNGTDSFIKREVDTWYSNALGNTIYDKMVNGGRFCSDSSGYKLDETFGFNVFASYDRLGQSANNFVKDNAPTLKCPVTTESYGGSYRLKAGLITADELVLGGEGLVTIGNSYLNSENSEMYWSMSPGAFGVSSCVWYKITVFSFDGTVNISGELRPVINVSTENGFASGEGTALNPYVIN